MVFCIPFLVPLHQNVGCILSVVYVVFPCLVRSLAEWLPWRVLPLAPACATVALIARNAGAALGLVPPLAHALQLSPCQGSDRLGANAQRRAVWVVRMYPRLVRSLAEWLPWRVLPLAPACATVALMARNAGAALGLVPPLAHALQHSPCQGSDRLGANAQRRAVWVVRMYLCLIRSLAEWLPWLVLPLAPARATVALMARNSGAALLWGEVVPQALGLRPRKS